MTLQHKILEDSMPVPIELILQISRDLGEVRSVQATQDIRISTVERDVSKRLDEIIASQAHITEKVDALQMQQAGMKGGWKTLTAVGTVVLVIAGFFAWVSDKWGAIRHTFFS